MKGVILVNAYTRSESELYQPRRLKSELETCGVKIDLVRNVCFQGVRDYDFCVYLDKDKYCARLLESAGMRLFNRAEAIELCDDKMLTYLALKGFPMPETLAAPLCYYPSEPVSETLINEVERTLGYPVVVKQCFGSLGKGVYKIDDREELERIGERLKPYPHIFQKFIGTSFGKDVRVVVVGGKTVCAMMRSSASFLSNVAAGGTGVPFELDEQAKQLCEGVARRLKLDYCGIDLLFGEHGFLVCEVNSNAFFAATERVTGINVAEIYAKYIVETMYGV